MSQLNGLAQAASSIGVEPSFLQTAVGSEGALLHREEVDDAIRLGVFSSPFFILNDELFFGVDKLELISTWLENGGL